ncbi:MAG: hypothetical protein ABIR35_02950, partial [Polaromonas sp.]
DERAPEVYAAFVRKLITWLTIKTGEGDLFEIDTALRPNGNSGLLVTPFDAYARYQQQRGSNTAWTWEHQAMTRARFVLGDVAPTLVASRTALPPEGAVPPKGGLSAELAPTLPTAYASLPPEEAELRLGRPSASFVDPTPSTACTSLPPEGAGLAWGGPALAAVAPTLPTAGASLRERFDEVRRAVITSPRDPSALRHEIMDMREKIRSAHPIRGGKFDVKHSAGGMVDAEFAVQYLVLSHAAQHPELVANVGNIALLQRAESAGLLPDGVGQRAAGAYRELRRVQHKARLNEEPTQVMPPALQGARDAIQALWAACFKSND